MEARDDGGEPPRGKADVVTIFLGPPSCGGSRGQSPYLLAELISFPGEGEEHGAAEAEALVRWLAPAGASSARYRDRAEHNHPLTNKVPSHVLQRREII